MPQHFASDNNAGICPEAFAALAEANQAGHAGGYGDDPWTVRAHAAIADVFEHKAKVFFAGNGTAANALVLAHLLEPFDAVIAHAQSHIEEDEANAVGFMGAGAKIVPLAAPDAKLTPDMVREAAGRGRGVHSTRARAVSLTQATELGTVYTPAEIAALCDTAHVAGMKVHMDGARFANAVATLACKPADISWRAGVDVLVFGGVKNGLGFGEAIVFFDAQEVVGNDVDWLAKEQIESRGRVVEDREFDANVAKHGENAREETIGRVLVLLRVDLTVKVFRAAECTAGFRRGINVGAGVARILSGIEQIECAEADLKRITGRIGDVFNDLANLRDDFDEFDRCFRTIAKYAN